MSRHRRQMISVSAATAFFGFVLSVAVPTAQAGKTPTPPVKYQLILIPLPAGSNSGTTGKINAWGDVGGLANGATRGFTGERGCLYRGSLGRTVELNDLVFYPGTLDYENPVIRRTVDEDPAGPLSPVADWLQDPKPFIVSAGDINENGQVIGAYWFRCNSPASTTASTTEIVDGVEITHYWLHNAFRYTLAGFPGGPAFQDLGTVAGQHGSRDVAINNQGDVLCVTEDPDVERNGSNGRHFVWTDAGTILLEGIPDSDDLLVTNINDLGEVAGTLYMAPYMRGAHAFVYNYLTPDYSDLGYLNNAPSRTLPQSWAIGLNSSAARMTVGGSVVGFDRTVSQDMQHAFRHTQDAGMTDLGILANGYKAYGYSVNKWGDVVGVCYMNSRASWQRRAFLYLDGWGMLDVWKLIEDSLGTDGHMYPMSLSINDSGEIAGTLNDGRPFILIPTKWIR